MRTFTALNDKVDIPANLHHYVRFAEFKRFLDRVDQRLPSEPRRGRSLAVLSLRPREGKTFLSAAIAIGYALHLKRRVLVIDTATGEPGSATLSLSRALGAETSGTPALPDRPARAGVEGVHFINATACGLDAASEYDLAGLASAYRDSFDTVVVDTCALEARNRRNFDPLVIARRLGTALLVTSPGERSPDWEGEVTRYFQGEPIQLVGLVDNRGKYAC